MDHQTSEDQVARSNDLDREKLAALFGDENEIVIGAETLDDPDVAWLLGRLSASERGMRAIRKIAGGAAAGCEHPTDDSPAVADASGHPVRLVEGADVSVRLLAGAEVLMPRTALPLERIDGFVESISELGLTLDLGPGGRFKLEAIMIPWASIQYVAHFTVPPDGRQVRMQRRLRRKARALAQS